MQTTTKSIYVGTITNDEFNFDGRPVALGDVLHLDLTQRCGCKPDCSRSTGSGSISLVGGSVLRVKNWHSSEEVGFLFTQTVTKFDTNLEFQFEIYCAPLETSYRLGRWDVIRIGTPESAHYWND